MMLLIIGLAIVAIICVLIMFYKYMKLVRELKIVDEYTALIYDTIYDYDGYYNPETKKGNIKGLVSLLDETKDFCVKIRERDDKTIIYGFNERGYNILFEEVKSER